MHIKQLPHSDLARIVEIDRSEHISALYRYRDGELEMKVVDWDEPGWPLEDVGKHSVQAHMRDWAPILEQGGVLLGALEEDRLAGFAILRNRLADTMAQLAVLHVSRGYRRQGVARRLVEEACRLARADGATEIYVSATPSNSAVNFYLSQGFRPTHDVHPELFALEPDDIHMTMAL